MKTKFQMCAPVAISLISLCMSSCGLKPNINSTLPVVPPALKIKGCMDNNATNVNPQAEEDDGSCNFKGCTIFDSSLKDAFNTYQNKFPAASIEDTCPAPVSDLFNQNNRPHVGILWVIDNSASMEPEQTHLANNFGSFIDEFINSRVDFTMGITTTDFDHRTNSLTQLTSEAANTDRAQLIKNFKKLVNVGIDGSSTEEGYESSLEFLEQNSKKLLKADSYLSIIYVSDEPDQSNISPQDYLSHLSKYVGSPHKFRSHAILDLNNSGKQDSSKGARYLYTVNKTGGVKGDVDDNFAIILKDIGNNLIDLKNMFKLSKIPYLPSLTVTQNGIIISTWKYNSVDNAIEFDPIPDFSSELSVNYTPVH